MQYKEPTWGGQAPEGIPFRLEVLRGGVILGHQDIAEKSYYTCGRQPGVDILMEHPSISRLQAVLQYNKEGALFLFDNGSTHGTYVNKSKLAAKEYCKLNVGDVLKFAQSTRLYIVEGPQELMPEEYDSEHLQQLRAQAKKVRPRGTSDARAALESAEVSWGMDEDAVNEDSSEGSDNEDEKELPEYLKGKNAPKAKTVSALDSGDIHDRDRKLFEKLQKVVTKIQHLEEEIQRITVKDNAQGGLTDGQQSQVDRNHKRIATLQEEMSHLEDTIKDKNKQRSAAAAASQDAASTLTSRTEKPGSDDDDSDDFYDRTQAKAATRGMRRFGRPAGAPPALARGGQPVVAVAETLESLVTRQAALRGEIERGVALLGELEASSGAQGGQEQDELDSYMAGVEEERTRQAKQQLLTRKREAESELAEVSRLVEIARPALPQRTHVPPPAVTPAAPSARPEIKDSEGVLGSAASTASAALLTVGREGASPPAGTTEPSDTPPIAAGGQVAAKARGAGTRPIGPEVHSVASDTPAGSEAMADAGSSPQRPKRRPQGPSAAPAQPAQAPKTAEVPANALTAADASPLPIVVEETDKQPDGAAQASKRKRGAEKPADPVARKRVTSLRNTAAKPDAAADKAEGTFNGLEGGDPDWVPPKGQTGDGKTALNAKFGY